MSPGNPVINNWLGYDDSWPYWNIRHGSQRNQAAIFAAIQAMGGDATDTLPALPPLLISTGVILGAVVPEGRLIEVVSYPWVELVESLLRDPDAVYRWDWRQWEEIIAGAYYKQGFKVTLTPRSGDGGKDIIAERDDFGAVCFYDQVKRYAPGHLVTRDEVDACLGVLSRRPNVSKMMMSTTSAYAPGVMADPSVTQFMPNRLMLRDKAELVRWLGSLIRGEKSDAT